MDDLGTIFSLNNWPGLFVVSLWTAGRVKSRHGLNKCDRPQRIGCWRRLRPRSQRTRNAERKRLAMPMA